MLEDPCYVCVLVVPVNKLLDETPQQLRRRHLPRVDAARQQHPPLPRIASVSRYDEGVDVVSALGYVVLSVGQAVVSREVRSADPLPPDEAGVLLDQVIHRLQHAVHRADARASLDRVVGEAPAGHRAERKQEDRLPCHHLIAVCSMKTTSLLVVVEASGFVVSGSGAIVPQTGTVFPVPCVRVPFTAVQGKQDLYVSGQEGLSVFAAFGPARSGRVGPNARSFGF